MNSQMIRSPYILYIILLLFSFSATNQLAAQEIGVSSFRILENDLTANTHGSMERDQNGDVCALIKVVTTEKGFGFDGGMVGIMKVVPKMAEIWVYVPHGIKRITIQHPQLGMLRDYYFPIPVEKARTYEMKLSTGQVQTVTNVTVQQQFVVFQVEPKDASIEINNEMLIANDQGMATKRLPYGRYTYQISSPNYHSQSGVVELTSENKVVVPVQLKPHFGWINLTSLEDYHGAYVYLNNERIGQLPMKTGLLKSGNYHIRIMKPMYKILEQDVEVFDNETTEMDIQLQPNFAVVTLVADAESEIWVESEMKGVGQCTLRLEPGQYKTEVRRASHQSSSMIVQVNNTETKSITLPKPVPLYGSMEILSSPMAARVYLDDAPVGETPLLLNNILIGAHRIRFESDGYLSLTQNIDVAHRQTASLDVTMEKEDPKPQEPQQYIPQYDNYRSKDKPRKANDAHANMAIYAGGGVILSNATFRYAAAQAGIYIEGVNAEYNYQFEKKFETQRYDFRLGYGFRLGNAFVLTPQVGFGARAGFDDYGEYRKLDEGVLLACRAQLCMGKYLSLSLMPTYHLMDDELVGQASLLFNIPLGK